MNVMKTPRSIDIAITHKCNLKCSYCSHFSSSLDVKNDLSLNEWLSFFNELQNCQVMRVCLQGGEPFCRNDLQEIIQGIALNKMRYNILSNGTLINNDIAKFIADSKRCDAIQVSIDGADSATHDYFRGKGSFEQAINGINILKTFSIPVSVRVTLHKKNIFQLPEIAKYLLKDLKLPSFSTNSASYMGLCRTNKDSVQLSIDEINYALKTLMILHQKYPGQIKGEAGPVANLKQWNRMENSRLNNEKQKDPYGYLCGCNCVMSNLSVRADGVFVPCIQLAHLDLGKINQNSLKDVWLKNKELQKLRTRNQISLKTFDNCRTCEYVNFCTGNCPAISYNLSNKINFPSPDACLKLFLNDGGKLPSIKNKM